MQYFKQQSDKRPALKVLLVGNTIMSYMGIVGKYGRSEKEEIVSKKVVLFRLES